MQLRQPLTLRRNFSWTLVGNVIYAASQWGILVLLAKLGDPIMVGQFTLGLAVTAPIFMLTNLQLRAIQATDAAQRYQFSDYLGLRIIGTGLAILITVAIACSGYRQETGLVILLIGLAKALESLSDLFYGLIQQHERMDRIAISLILRGCLSLVLVGFAIYLTRQVLWGVVGLVVVWATVLVNYDLKSGAFLLHNHQNHSRKRFALDAFKPSWQWSNLNQLFQIALPMGFVMMLISLNGSIPRYLVERNLGERELGIFAAIAYLIVAGGTVVNALGQAASPRLAKYYANGDRHAFWKLFLKLLGIGAGIGSIAILVALIGGKPILSILYQPEYAQYADLFVWLMVAGGISYIGSCLGYGMTAAQYFRVQLPLFGVVTAVSFLTCLLLIPMFGLQGAATSLILSAIVQVGISLGVIFHAMHRLYQYTVTIQNSEMDS